MRGCRVNLRVATRPASDPEARRRHPASLRDQEAPRRSRTRHGRVAKRPVRRSAKRLLHRIAHEDRAPRVRVRNKRNRAAREQRGLRRIGKAGICLRRPRNPLLATSRNRRRRGPSNVVMISPEYRVSREQGTRCRTPPKDPGDPRIPGARLPACRGADVLCAGYEACAENETGVSPTHVRIVRFAQLGGG